MFIRYASHFKIHDIFCPCKRPFVLAIILILEEFHFLFFFLSILSHCTENIYILWRFMLLCWQIKLYLWCWCYVFLIVWEECEGPLMLSKECVRDIAWICTYNYKCLFSRKRNNYSLKKHQNYFTLKIKNSYIYQFVSVFIWRNVSILTVKKIFVFWSVWYHWWLSLLWWNMQYYTKEPGIY